MDCWTEREEPIKNLENNISKTASGGGAPASLPPEEYAHMRPSALGGTWGAWGYFSKEVSTFHTQVSIEVSLGPLFLVLCSFPVHLYLIH